jgi:undecaprenyl-diphosphatase
VSKMSKEAISPLWSVGKHLFWGITAGIFFLALFAKLSEELLSHELEAFDTMVGQFIRSFSTPWLTYIAIGITQVGSAQTEVTLMLIVGAYLLFRLKHIWETVLLTSSLMGAWLLNVMLKNIFHRARPDIQHLVEAGGYSFPSGHAMVAAAYYGMMGYLLWLTFPLHVITRCGFMINVEGLCTAVNM